MCCRTTRCVIHVTHEGRDLAKSVAVPGGLGPHLVSGLQPFDFLGVRTWACIVPDEQARPGPIPTQASIVRAFSALKAPAEDSRSRRKPTSQLRDVGTRFRGGVKDNY